MTEICDSIAVLGNCTHISLVETIKLNQLCDRAASFEVYSTPPERRQELADSLEGFDLVLTLEHGDNFGPLSTATLKTRYPDKVYSVPTPFFSGAQPDMAYIKRGGAIDRARHILGDYQSALILRECQSGRTRDETVARYKSGAAFEEIDLVAIWNDALAELEAREQHTEIKLSPFIKEFGLGEQLFVTFNHPKEMVIRYIVEQFVSSAAGYLRSLQSLQPESHNLYQNVLWPTHPRVAEILGAKHHDQFMSFRRPLSDGGDVLDWATFAAQSYDYFMQDGDPAEFSIVTPSYLHKHLGGL